MNHIVRDADKCGNDWCDAKQSLLKQQEISRKLAEQVALLRQTLIDYGSHTSSNANFCEVCKALEATK